jgi:outer membrane protein
MKKLWILAFGFMMCTHVLEAQKIAIIDVTAILEEMPEYKAAQQEIDQASAKWRQEISQIQDEIKSMYNKYQAEQVLLSDDARRKREDEIMKKEASAREMQRQRFGPEGDLFNRRQQLIAPLQDKIFSKLESYATDRAYDVILDKSSTTGLLYFGVDMDKTDDFRKIVNR